MRGSDGVLEEEIEWYTETGIVGFESPDRKYISRFNLQIWAQEKAKLTIFIEYDSSGIWQEFPAIFFYYPGTHTIPITPRRCHHFRIRLLGKGDVKIFSITNILEMGSDI